MFLFVPEGGAKTEHDTEQVFVEEVRVDMGAASPLAASER